MAGPAPKPPGQRRRRNAAQTSWRTFDASSRRRGRVPALPARRPAWSSSTRAWWRRLWLAPMAAAYLEADLGALHRLAELVELFARGEHGVANELRQLEDRFGLSPKSRQLLQWQVLAAGEPATAANAAAATAAATPASNVRRLRAIDPKAAAS